MQSCSCAIVAIPTFVRFLNIKALDWSFEYTISCTLVHLNVVLMTR